jgi:hypothetical protein
MATKVKETKPRKSFEERKQERLERASRPGAMVLTLQSFDTRLVVNMIGQIDRQFRFSRDRLFQDGFEVEKIEPYFKKWQELEKSVNDFAKSFSKLTGVRYFDPLKNRVENTESTENAETEVKV